MSNRERDRREEQSRRDRAENERIRAETGHLPGPRKVLRYEDLKEYGIDLSQVTLWRLIRDKLFPAPFKIGRQTNCWLADDIEDYLNKQIAARG